MTVYSVHRKRNAAPDAVTLVPEGFNTAAFLFTVIWALWNRLWVVAAILAAGLAAATVLPAQLGLSTQSTGMIQLAVLALVGFEANDLRRLGLSRAGYDEVDLVSGSNLAEAELRYFASRPRPAVQPKQSPESVPARYSHDTLGLFGNV